MIEDHFPEFYRRADSHSVDWQKRYLWSQKVQLSSLLGAAVAAAVGVYGLVVVLLFALATMAELYRLVSRADEKWWNGRAGAESAKTASWLYVVGGAPFGHSNANAEVELAMRLAEVAVKVAKLLPVATAEAHVSPEMTRLRSQPLTERISTYQRERIQDQSRWYASKSRLNERRARWWSLGVIAAQALGLLLGIVAMVNDWQLDFVGVFSALGATAVAWVAVKQYETLARSYAVASAELSTIDVQIRNGSWTEANWAAFVNAAEEAISREHTSWRASRAV